MGNGSYKKDSLDTIQDIKKTVYTNTPEKDEKKDFFRMDITCQEIKGAIEDGASMIGVISDYGGGKTSLVQSLEHNNDQGNCTYHVCNICLWNFSCDNQSDDMETVSNMTHSFLYQLAKGMVNAKFARHINRMISKNYGMISFGIYFAKKRIIGLISVAFLYLLFLLLPVLFLNPDSQGTILYKLLQFAQENENKVNILIAGLLILVLSNGSITFSNKASLGNRKPGVVDAYEIFDYIISEALAHKMGKSKRSQEKTERYIICIEDLDRLESEEDILKFLKELYKYHMMLSSEQRNKFIFLISASQGWYRNMEQKNTKTENLYSKIFDYTIELKPIHKDDRHKLIRQLINDKGVSAAHFAGTGEDAMDRAVEWIGKGDNLGIRDFKLRLNKAFSIQKALNIEGQDFDKSALVAYLEDQYVSEVYSLIHDQERLCNFMSEVKIIKKEYSDEEKRKTEITELAKACNYYELCTDKEFMEEWITILSRNTITDDYEKYFFRYTSLNENKPKSS